jgi:hypothetical protein
MTREQTKSIEVNSREKWNDSGLDLVAGMRYRLTVSGVWRDAGHPAGPDGWQGTVASNLFVWLRRARQMPWFALVGSINKEQPYFHLMPPEFVSPANGRLYCFANDAPGFYFNNEGSLKLEIVPVS